ncbi:MFS transporter [Tenuibacillus multivorans]|uniref:Transmembrane secretion effector n=1 Tax=Tenuibacillus multivorans TaxID=237069 RepID=A0A1G9YKV4_9BACI|nr:MFS transporter [Tenuibacillus multivorans]GEL78454.1 MFS transporter [Tenuibacillus multivorans]SDN09710.1 Transmembrane secretion effector [Tenuibacillus multivorans]
MKLLVHNLNFFNMWFSNFVGILNDRFRELIIPLIVLGLTHSPLITGLVALSQQLGTVLFSIPIGTWLENKDKVKISGICHFLYAVGLSLLSFLVTINRINEFYIALTLFLLGILAIIIRTSFNVLIPNVSGRENLLEAHTSVEGADAISTLIGPTIAGVVLAKLGASLTLGVCSISSLVSMIFILRVKHDRGDTNRIQSSNNIKERMNEFISKSKSGLKYLVQNSSQIICTITICSLGFSTVFIVLTVILHTEISLNLSETFIGILLSCAGVGNVIGVLVISKFKRMNWLTLLSTLMIISSLGVFIIFLTNNFILMCLGMILFDGALSMAFVVQGAVHQGITPDEFLSRVRSATYVISGLFTMLGTFLAGFIPEFFTTHFSLAFGVCMLLISAIVLLKFKRIGEKFDQIKPIYAQK